MSKTEFRGGHLGFLPMNGSKKWHRFKVKSVKISKSIGVKNIAKIPSGYITLYTKTKTKLSIN